MLRNFKSRTAKIGIMLFMCLLVTLFAGLSISSVSSRGQLASQLDFKPKRLHLVNRIGSNYLFRGNFPGIGDGSVREIEIDVWKNTMAAKLKAAGMRVPPKYKIIDISLLSRVVESADISLERNFFQADPSMGNFIYHPILGSLLSPANFSKSFQELIVSEELYGVDDLPKLLENIHSILKEPSALPKFVYVHCEAGIDRTGEVMGAYSMQYRKLSYAQAVQENDAVLAVSGRSKPISYFSLSAIQWYALYLREVLDRDHIGSIEGVD